MTDRFEDLRTFVAVVDAGGFNLAADRLGLVKSAVSRRIRDLEIRLGAVLVHRTTRQLSVTEAGQAFYERALRLLSDLDEAEETVSAANVEVAGRLRVSAPVSFAAHCLAPVVGAFLASNPRLELEIDTDDRLVDIVGGRFDMAIRISRLRDSTLMARRIATVRHACCASPAFLDQHGRPAVPGDIAGMPGIGYSNVEARRYWTFAGGETVPVRSRIEFGNGDAIREAAIAGTGIVMLPTFIVHEAVRCGQLEIVLADHMREPLGMHAVHSSSRNAPARLRAFIRFLVSSFGNEPFWDRGIVATDDNGAPDEQENH